MEEEEYELVPLSPLRRMEKRMDRLEKSGTSNDMVRELIDVVRTNQQIVDDMVKINSDIINKIGELTASVNQSMAKIDEFLNRVEVGGAEEPVAEEIKPAAVPVSNDADKRMDKLEKRINSLLLSSVAKSKLGSKLQKRPVPQY
jgi:hypothetical protein